LTARFEFFVVLDDFNVSLHDTFGCAAFRFTECEFKRLAHIRLVRADSGNADRGPLPHVLVICFRDSDVEFGSKAIFQSADDHSFVFEGLRMRNGDVQREQGDGNYRVTSTFSVTKASMMSPTLRSLKFWTPMPHSYPRVTSDASSLNRFSDEILPS
jgi:hypothetical protein